MEAIAVPKRKIGDSLEVASVVNGLWQVAGGHGKVTAADAQKHVSIILVLILLPCRPLYNNDEIFFDEKIF
jgi:hypothetical protein